MQIIIENEFYHDNNGRESLQLDQEKLFSCFKLKTGNISLKEIGKI